MINAILLLLNPVATWQRLAAAHRSILFLLAVHLLPLMLLATAVEAWGLVHWGKPRGAFGQAIPLATPLAVRYAVLKFAAQLLVVFVAALAMTAIARSFRARRGQFTAAFTLVAFALAPYFLVQMFHAVPVIPGWIVWVAAVTLACAPLYQGVPQLLEPDPPLAFALYLMGAITFVGTTGLAHFVCELLLRQELLAAT
jgi:hypothetical protein